MAWLADSSWAGSSGSFCLFPHVIFRRRVAEVPFPAAVLLAPWSFWCLCDFSVHVRTPDAYAPCLEGADDTCADQVSAL